MRQLHAEYNRENDTYLAHRAVQAYHLAKLINQFTDQEDFVILCGDMNSEPVDPCYRILKELPQLKDCWQECGLKVKCSEFILVTLLIGWAMGGEALGPNFGRLVVWLLASFVKISYCMWFHTWNTYGIGTFSHMKYLSFICETTWFKISHVNCNYSIHAFYIWNGRFTNESWFHIQCFCFTNGAETFSHMKYRFICEMTCEILVTGGRLVGQSVSQNLIHSLLNY